MIRDMAFKLVSCRKNGTFGPLFIDKRLVFTFNKWFTAKRIPTKGFTVRPGWHVVANPHAPHLIEKNRAWLLVEIKNFRPHFRPAYQGGRWYVAKKMRIISVWRRGDA